MAETIQTPVIDPDQEPDHRDPDISYGEAVARRLPQELPSADEPSTEEIFDEMYPPEPDDRYPQPESDNKHQ